MNILIALLVIALLILVHEWGHFMAARRVGIKVYEFSLGFGSKLLSINRGGVDYSLRIFPLGGFVRVAGMEPDDRDNPEGYQVKTPLEKIRFIFAGAFMNFVLAILIFVFIFAFVGLPKAAEEARIGELIAGLPAEQAGVQPNDLIIAVDGESVNSWSEFIQILHTSAAGDPLEFMVLRAEERLTLKVIPELVEGNATPIIGVYPQLEYERQGIISAIKQGLIQTYEITLLILGSVWMLITGAASTSDLAGPVGIVKMVGDSAQGGYIYLLSFTALLSINLGILNLLPIPALDGSRIVFVIIEAIRKKPMEPEKEGIIHFVGFVFLMLLIVLVTYNDIVRLIKG